MNHVVVVKVVDGFENLLDRLGSISLCKFAVFADPVKQLSPSGQLGHYVVFVLYDVKHEQSAFIDIIASEIEFGSITLDSNQSWNRTMLGCFILCSRTISSYTIFSLPLTFFLRMILIAYLSPPHSASRTIPYVPAPNVLPNRYWDLDYA